MNVTSSSAFECNSIPARAVSWALVGDGVCDCCNGADETPATRVEQCPDTCDAERVALMSRLATIAQAHEDGVKRARKEILPPQRLSGMRAHLKASADEAAADAMQVRREYDRQVDAIKKRGQKISQSTHQQLQRLQDHVKHMKLMSAVAANRATAAFGKGDHWLSLLGRCAFSQPITEKLTKGGSTTSIPKRYIYGVCFGGNVTQAEWLPDEWIRADQAAVGKGITTVEVRADGRTAPTANRTVSDAWLVGTWRGYLPFDSFDAHLWTAAPRYNAAASVAPQRGGGSGSSVVSAVGDTDVASMVAVYEGQGVCRSEGITTHRAAYVFHVCPGMSPSDIELADSLFHGLDGYAYPRLPHRFHQQAWNALPGHNTTLEIVHVHEDGLCAYKVYVATPLACSRTVAAAARSLIQQLE